MLVVLMVGVFDVDFGFWFVVDKEWCEFLLVIDVYWVLCGGG